LVQQFLFNLFLLDVTTTFISWPKEKKWFWSLIFLFFYYKNLNFFLTNKNLKIDKCILVHNHNETTNKFSNFYFVSRLFYHTTQSSKSQQINIHFDFFSYPFKISRNCHQLCTCFIFNLFQKMYLFYLFWYVCIAQDCIYKVHDIVCEKSI